MITAKIVEKMEEYLEIPATTAFEEPFFDYLEKDFIKIGCEAEKHDKVLVVTKGNKNKNIVTCHIDREGLFVNEKKDVEYVVYHVRRSNGQTVRGTKDKADKIGSDFVGCEVFSYNSKGEILETGRVLSYDFNLDEELLFFKVKGFNDLLPNQALSFGNNLKTDEKYISGQTDNVISVATLYKLVEDGFEGTILFAAEEEIGRSGTCIAEYFEKTGVSPQNVLSIDITPYGDKGPIDDGLIVLRNKDGRGNFNSELVDVLKSICKKENLKYQMKDEHLVSPDKMKPYKGLGFTELGQIVKASGGKISGATVQLPVYHEKMHIETTSYKALHNYYFFLKKITE